MQAFTIGRAAREAGVNIETVRFYERRGLIEQPPKGEGYRIYSAEQVARIPSIARGTEPMIRGHLPSSMRGRARAGEALRSIGQENLTSPRIPRTVSLGYRRKGAEPWLLTVASPSGSTADVADLAFGRACVFGHRAD